MKKIRAIMAAASAAVCILLTSCGGSEDSSAAKESSAQTAAPAVTLPSDGSQAEIEAAAESLPEDSSQAEADTERGEYAPAMWLVTSPEGETMYMMGSMHALKEECYPLPDYVQEAYEQADVLAVECDITDATSLFSAGMTQLENMYYEDGRTLADILPAEQYENIKGYLNAHDLQMSDYEDCQLWYLSSALESVAVTDAELNTTLGLDVNLLNDAHEDGKEIYEVESVSAQVDMLLGFSDEIYTLVTEGYSEENSELIAEQLNELYEAWRTGDLATIEQLNSGESTDPEEEYTAEEQALIDEYNKQMLTDRNLGMAQAAKDLMAEGKNAFYVVGAAHFVGEDGIIRLLTDEGYTFEVINY